MSLPDTQTKKSLRASLFDGIFANGMIGFTQDYFAPFLLLIGGSARQIGLLAALPNFFSSLLQLKSADLSEKFRSRLNFVCRFVFFQALVLLPTCALALFSLRVPIYFIIAVVFFTCFNALVMPAWSSLMSDLIAENQRGRYFGWRNKVCGFVLVGATFIAGLILQVFKKINPFFGFALLFFCAFIFRLASWYFLTRMHEPPLEQKKEHYFSLFDFLARLKESNFAKFVIFISLMIFSVNLAAPYFVVLMIRDWHFSYLLYSFITVTATLSIYLTIGRWGKLADQVGNLKMIKISSRLISLIPLLWIINHHPLYLFFVQVFSGFAWAGFNLCSVNFIYDAVTPPKRIRCIAYFNAFSGIAICAGALCGGFLLKYLPEIFGYKVLSLILLSAIFRLAFSLFISSKLREVRAVKNMSDQKLLFSMLGLRSIELGEQN
jgi:MFS family permease